MSGPTPHPSCYTIVVNSGRFESWLRLTPSKSLRTTICITSGVGFGVEAAPVSAEVSDGWPAADITDLDEPLVARE